MSKQPKVYEVVELHRECSASYLVTLLQSLSIKHNVPLCDMDFSFTTDDGYIGWEVCFYRDQTEQEKLQEKQRLAKIEADQRKQDIRQYNMLKKKLGKVAKRIGK